MRTDRLLTIPCSIRWEGVLPTPTTPTLEADPPPHFGGRPLWGCRPLDADPSGHVTCDACWEANPPSCGQKELQMLVKPSSIRWEGGLPTPPHFGGRPPTLEADPPLWRQTPLRMQTPGCRPLWSCDLWCMLGSQPPLLWTEELQMLVKQECIPVGCVLPAAVAIWGVCLSACWDTPPWVWAWRPPWVWAWKPHLGLGLETPPGCWPGDPQVWAWRPPQVGLESPVWACRPPQARPLNFPHWVWAWRPPLARPLNFPLDVGLETCKACWDTPRRPAARHTGIPLQCMLGYYPSPHEQNNRHV